MPVNFCPHCASPLATASIEGIARAVCPNAQCTFVHWNNPVPVVAALVALEGRYVIACNRAWPKGIYSLIAGYLEACEVPAQAAKREVEEELGLQTGQATLIGNFAFPDKNQVIMAYEVQASGTVTLNHELRAWKALSVPELLDYDFSPLYLTKQIIAAWEAACLPRL